MNLCRDYIGLTMQLKCGQKQNIASKCHAHAHELVKWKICIVNMCLSLVDHCVVPHQRECQVRCIQAIMWMLYKGMDTRMSKKTMIS